MKELYCVCGSKVTETAGGYTCFRCFRKYSVKGKLINCFIEFSERAERMDDKTMHFYPEEEK